jgi:hypothetical protein
MMMDELPNWCVLQQPFNAASQFCGESEAGQPI